jgi:hypothetical protein
MYLVFDHSGQRGCDIDYLVVAKVREKLAVNTQRSQTFHMERFSQAVKRGRG